MSVFRPVRRVVGPGGDGWEIYAYRISVAHRRAGDFDDSGLTYGRAFAVGWVVEAVVWLVLLIPYALLRLFDLLVAAVRTIGSDDWTIDAVTYRGHETIYRWTTTSEHKGQVLAQVEGHLARGEIPLHLRNAVYRGELRR
jgi:hypothetical protein